MTAHYDYVIVGAGSSGAVLAARLSEDPATSVLLLEAGPDYPSIEQMPEDLLNAYWVSLRDHDWGFKAESVPGRDIDYARGKVTGGSSAVNGAVAIRGVPADYNEWAALGNEGWEWENCLPYFNKLEDDQDQGGDYHGKGGPIPVRRWKPNELTRLQQAFRQACIDQGYPFHEDFNDPDSTGISPIAQNREGRTRISTAIGYLTAARPRLNLTIRGHCLANRVLIEDGRAVGLEVESGGELQRVDADNVVLSAGTLQSPPIMLRSGIGSAEDVATLGVDLIHELPGVGHNLIDHCMAFLFCVPKEGVCDLANPFFQTMLRYTSDGGEANDMQMYAFNYWALTDLPEMREIFGVDLAFAIAPSLQRPHSRGRLHVESIDLHAAPRIELNGLDDAFDRARMREGMRIACDIAHAPDIAKHWERIELLDQALIDDDDALDRYIFDTAWQNLHPVGTAKMGPRSDPEAVVDAHGRVHGIDGLRVVDAAIMPTIPRANTNLTCIMIGERVADWINAGE